MDSNSEKPSLSNPERRISRRALLKLGGAAAAGAGAAYIAYRIGIKDQKEPEKQETEVIPLPEFLSPAKDQNVLVSLLKDTITEELFPKDKIESMMENVNKFYEKNSYGKISFSSEVIDWQTADSPIEPTDLEKMAQLGNNAVESGRLASKPNSTRVYFIDRRGKKYDVGGRGEKSVPFNRVWIYADEFEATHLHQIKHELGHALGLEHVDFVSSRFLSGSPEFELSFDDFTNNLRTDNAGGTVDIMGRGGGYFCAPHKIELGWIKDDQIKTASSNGTYDLSPIENGKEKTLALRIPKTDTNEFYYIEYRQPDETEKNVDPGLYFYMWDEKAGSNVKQFYIRPGHRYVKTGDEFYDKINGVRVKVVDQNGRARLNVSFEPKKF